MNKGFICELLSLVEETPDLNIMCMVDSDIVADDGYAWWLGTINMNDSPEIKEYTTEINDKVEICRRKENENDTRRSD